MSTLAKYLPSEIWLHALGMLQHNKEELLTCRLVCKTWNILAERVLYKEVNMDDWKADEFSRFGSYLSARPDLGQVVQKIQIKNGVKDKWSFIRILKLTPNLKIITGTCSFGLMERFLTPELALLHLQELPHIEAFDLSLQTKLICHYKDTLRSVHIDLKENMDPNLLAVLMDSIGQCHKMTRLHIWDVKYFQGIKQLEWILEFCKHIEELRLEIRQSPSYTHMEQSELTQWLEINVQKIDTVKKLEIQYHADGIYANRKQHRRFGPDWMEFLAFKYPKVENLHIVNNPVNRQLIIQPAFKHLATVNLQGVTFTDPEVFKQSISSIGSMNVHIKLNVIGGDGMGGWPFICIMNANKERNATCTTFKFDMLYDSLFDTDLTTLLSSFSTRKIQHVSLVIDSEYSSTLLSKVARAKFDIHSLEIITGTLRIERKHAESLASLRELHLNETRVNAKHINQLGRMTPNLTHLKLSNCSLKNINLAPQSQLALLELHSEYANYQRLLFYVSLATSSSEHYFIAARNKPLQIVSRQEYNARKDPAIRITCGTLQHLKVDMDKIKFIIKFDVEQGHIKSANIGMEKPMCRVLVQKRSTLKEDHKAVQEAYPKAKKHSSASQLESIKKDSSVVVS